jgi:NAD(P)-dependent dehydrogenase (short-subunit alcohol dehydrogenase family)
VTIQFERHRAVVVGAGGTIGSAVCRAYAEAGAAVVGLDLHDESARAAVADLAGEGHGSGRVDVTDAESVQRALARRGPTGRSTRSSTAPGSRSPPT